MFDLESRYNMFNEYTDQRGNGWGDGDVVFEVVLKFENGDGTGLKYV